MGLALLIVILKALALRTGDTGWNDAARFWIRIFGINFAVGVVTGIPMEFQFGTNWARFARYAGPVIGQTLAMEGLFAFFLESSFLALLVWGERKLGRIGHYFAALALFAGSWLSGYFIVCTNAFMQNPVGHEVLADGTFRLVDFGAFLWNPWALAAYAHNMVATVVTGSFVVAACGAFYTLRGLHLEQAGRFLRVGVIAGLIASVAVAFPTGDHQGKLLAKKQPAALAAMEGRFTSGPFAEITLIGQPNVHARTLDNPIRVPGVLSFLAYGTFHSNVPGLQEFPEDAWPDNIELLYYSFHVMAGLGTLMIGLMLIAAVFLWNGSLARTRPILWALLLAFPFPYIATTAGWMTAELGRQPWIIYGIMKTADAVTPMPGLFYPMLLFSGVYVFLSAVVLWLLWRQFRHAT